MSEGRLVILSGPSGVGKDTVLDAWKVVNPRVKRVVAYTTRSPREGERDGIDYHFRSVSQFQGLAGEGAFLEDKVVHGNHYATPLYDMNAMLSIGLIAVLKIDVQGALTVMKLRSDALTVFLLPPSPEELERRIRGRGLDSEEVIEHRLAGARAELALADHYQYQLTNSNVEGVVAELERLVGA